MSLMIFPGAHERRIGRMINNIARQGRLPRWGTIIHMLITGATLELIHAQKLKTGRWSRSLLSEHKKDSEQGLSWLTLGRHGTDEFGSPANVLYLWEGFDEGGWPVFHKFSNLVTGWSLVACK